MPDAEILFWLKLLVVVHTVSQAIVAALCFVWARYPKRRWIRVMFILFGTGGVAASLIRIGVVALSADWPVLVVVAASLNVLTSLITAGALVLCTVVFIRRHNHPQFNRTRSGKTSDLTGEVYEMLLTEGRKAGWV